MATGTPRNSAFRAEEGRNLAVSRSSSGSEGEGSDEPWDERPATSDEESGKMEDKYTTSRTRRDEAFSSGAEAVKEDVAELDDGDLPALSLSRQSSPASQSGQPLMGGRIVGGQRTTTRPLSPPSQAGLVTPPAQRGEAQQDRQRRLSGDTTGTEDDMPDDEMAARKAHRRHMDDDSQQDDEAREESGRYNRSLIGDVMDGDENICSYTLTAMGNICVGTKGGDPPGSKITAGGERSPKRPVTKPIDRLQPPYGVEEQTAIEIEYVDPRPIRFVEEKKIEDKDSRLPPSLPPPMPPEGFTPERKSAYLAAMAKKAREDYDKSDKTKKKSARGNEKGSSEAQPVSETSSETHSKSEVANPDNVYSSFNATEKRKFLKLINSGLTPSESTKRVLEERELPERDENNNAKGVKGSRLKFWNKKGKDNQDGLQHLAPGEVEETEERTETDMVYPTKPGTTKRINDEEEAADIPLPSVPVTSQAHLSHLENDGNNNDDERFARSGISYYDAVRKERADSDDEEEVAEATPRPSNKKKSLLPSILGSPKNKGFSPLAEKETRSMSPPQSGNKRRNMLGMRLPKSGTSDPPGVISSPDEQKTRKSDVSAKDGLYVAVGGSRPDSREVEETEEVPEAAELDETDQEIASDPVVKPQEPGAASELLHSSIDSPQNIEGNDGPEMQQNTPHPDDDLKPLQVDRVDESMREVGEQPGMASKNYSKELVPHDDDRELDFLEYEPSSTPASAASPAELREIENPLNRPISSGATNQSPAHTYSNLHDGSVPMESSRRPTAIKTADQSPANTDSSLDLASPDSLREAPENEEKVHVGEMALDLDTYLDSTEIYSTYGGSVQDHVSVVSSKSYRTHGTSYTNGTGYTAGTSGKSVSSRKRRPGAAKSRLAKVKEAQKAKAAREMGWQESIEAAAANSNRVWDPVKGWVDYVDPATLDVDHDNHFDEKIQISLQKIREQKGASVEDSTTSEVQKKPIPFPAQWEGQRAAMIQSPTDVARHEELSVQTPQPGQAPPPGYLTAEKVAPRHASPKRSPHRKTIPSKATSPSKPRGWIETMRAASANIKQDGRRWDPEVGWVGADDALEGAHPAQMEPSLVKDTVVSPVRNEEGSFPVPPPNIVKRHNPQFQVETNERNYSANHQPHKEVQHRDNSHGSHPQDRDHNNSNASFGADIKDAFGKLDVDNLEGEERASLLVNVVKEKVGEEDANFFFPEKKGILRKSPRRGPGPVDLDEVDDQLNEDGGQFHEEGDETFGVTQDFSFENDSLLVGKTESTSSQQASHSIPSDRFNGRQFLEAPSAGRTVPKLMRPKRDTVPKDGSFAQTQITPGTKSVDDASPSGRSHEMSSGAGKAIPKLMASKRDTNPKDYGLPQTESRHKPTAEPSESQPENVSAKPMGLGHQASSSSPPAITALKSKSEDGKTPTSRSFDSVGSGKPIPRLKGPKRDTSPIRSRRPQEDTITPRSEEGLMSGDKRSEGAVSAPSQTSDVGTTEGSASHSAVEDDAHTHHTSSSSPSSGSSVKMKTQQWESRVKSSEEEMIGETELVPEQVRTEEWKSFLNKKVRAESAAAAKLQGPQHPIHQRQHLESLSEKNPVLSPSDGEGSPMKVKRRMEDDRDSLFDFEGLATQRRPQARVPASSRSDPNYVRQGDMYHANRSPESPLDERPPDSDSSLRRSQDDRAHDESFEEISQISPIRPQEDSFDSAPPEATGSQSALEKSEVTSDTSSAVMNPQGSFLQRLQACTGPIMPRISGENGDSVPMAHLAFLRTNPPIKRSQGVPVGTPSKFIPPGLCGRPDVIAEEEEAEEDIAEKKAAATQNMHAATTQSEPKPRPRSNPRSGRSGMSDVSSVISDEFGAKTAYLEAIAMRTAVSGGSKRSKRRSPSSDTGSKQSGASSKYSGTSSKQSEKWQQFLERKNAASPAKSRSSALDVSEAAEKYAAEKVEEMMEVMASRPSDETGAFPRHDDSPPSASYEMRSSRSDGERPSSRSRGNRKSDSARAAEDLAAARVEAMMQTLSSTNLDEGEI